MAEASLDRVLAFHQELAALSAAGLPIGHDLGHSHQAIVSRLKQIDAGLSLRTSLGQSIDQAIAAESSLPPRHRDILLAWLHCEHPDSVLDAISRPAVAVSNVSHLIALSFHRLLIVLVLACFAFVVLCLWATPQIDAIYSQLGRQPDWISSLLTAMTAWMPMWGFGFPLVMVTAALLGRSRLSQMQWEQLPGASTYFAAVRNANVADQLAELLDSDQPLPASVSLAASSSSGAAGSQPTDETGNVADMAMRLPDEAQIRSLPPVFHWALSDLHPGSPQDALRFAATSYRRLAEHQRRRWLVLVPGVIGVLVSGVLVLAYGLSVFLPVIWLLMELAIPGG